MGKYEHLLSPIEIRGNKYRNRIINGPTLFAHSVFLLPEMRENVYRMVENRAKGGAAAVSTGEVSVNFEEARCLFLNRAIDFTSDSGPDFDAFKEYADRIKKHGALAYLEFCHEGARSEVQPPYQPWGPDTYVREDGVQVKGMDAEMMQKVCRDFYTIAKFARMAGFDGVLIHGGHGFLMQQFVSTWTNHRTDEYGGSMENRARFPKMLIQAVRKGLGDDKIIELRFSAEDGDGDMTIDDTVEFCIEIDGMVDIIHVSNGLKWAGNRTQTFSDFFDIHGVNVGHAEKIKAAVQKSKVAVIGGINSPEQGEEIIASGKADFIVLGRQGFADPEFANKTINDHAEDIRRCVRCYNCYPGFCEHETDIHDWEAQLSPGDMGICAINPDSGFLHYEENYPLPEGNRDVLVIGGGVGGMQAALTAAQRGHQVTLAEKDDKLGGILNFTEHDPDKVDLLNFKNLLIRQVQKNVSIDVKMKLEVNQAAIEKLNPDAVIIAVGAEAMIPPIPGIDKAVIALDTYYYPERIGEMVVLVGGGLVGCETGAVLAAAGKTVSIVEMGPRMAPECVGYYRNALMDELDKRKIIQYLETKCLEICENGVKVEHHGKESFIAADTVVFSMGMKAKTTLAASLEASCRNRKVFMIGDCVKTGKVVDAVSAGYKAALEII